MFLCSVHFSDMYLHLPARNNFLTPSPIQNWLPTSFFAPGPSGVSREGARRGREPKHGCFRRLQSWTVGLAKRQSLTLYLINPNTDVSTKYCNNDILLLLMNVEVKSFQAIQPALLSRIACRTCRRRVLRISGEQRRKRGERERSASCVRGEER